MYFTVKHAQGESFVVHPKDFGKTISVPVSPPRDIPVDLHIKVKPAPTIQTTRSDN